MTLVVTVVYSYVCNAMQKKKQKNSTEMKGVRDVFDLIGKFGFLFFVCVFGFFYEYLLAIDMVVMVASVSSMSILILFN